MKIHGLLPVIKTDSRASPFAENRAHGHKQRLYVRKRDIARNGICKNGHEGFAVPAIHEPMIAFFAIVSSELQENCEKGMATNGLCGAIQIPRGHQQGLAGKYRSGVLLLQKGQSPTQLTAYPRAGYRAHMNISPCKPTAKARHIYIIAGPNGAGKTTFARRFVPASVNITQFINADLIAAGLSPFAPEREAIQAGRLMLRQIEKLVAQGESFSFETTLAGRSYARMIPQWQAKSYVIHLLFLALPDAETAMARVAARVAQGGHAIPEDVIRRRFAAGLRNFHSVYKLLVNGWTEYDNSGPHPVQVATGENHGSTNNII